MSLGSMLRSSSWTPMTLVGPLLIPLALALVYLLPGWSRLLAVVPMLALAISVLAYRANHPQAGWEACAEAIDMHAERTRDLSKLQESLAHELRNPLATIKGLAGLISLEPQRAAERVGVLSAEILRMETILEEYLTFARPLTPMAIERINIGELTRSVVDLYEGMARQRDVELVAAPSSVILIDCDGGKVKQVLASLVHNAIDASPEGETIELRIVRDAESIHMHVLDRGPGVAEQDIARLLEPGVTTKPDGTGLGLTLARAIAEQHGGSLVLRNREGGGLDAVLELRLCRQPE
jgi:two-component system, NtrC family, sensor histidine kinase HydH